MNWDQVEGKWKEFKGNARTKWAVLTENDLEEIAGNKDKLLGKLQQQYGRSKEQAELEVKAWMSDLGDTFKSKKN